MEEVGKTDTATSSKGRNIERHGKNVTTHISLDRNKSPKYVWNHVLTDDNISATVGNQDSIRESDKDKNGTYTITKNGQTCQTINEEKGMLRGFGLSNKNEVIPQDGGNVCKEFPPTCVLVPVLSKESADEFEPYSINLFEECSLRLKMELGESIYAKIPSYVVDEQMHKFKIKTYKRPQDSRTFAAAVPITCTENVSCVSDIKDHPDHVLPSITSRPSKYQSNAERGDLFNDPLTILEAQPKCSVSSTMEELGKDSDCRINAEKFETCGVSEPVLLTRSHAIKAIETLRTTNPRYSVRSCGSVNIDSPLSSQAQLPLSHVPVDGRSVEDHYNSTVSAGNGKLVFSLTGSRMTTDTHCPESHSFQPKQYESAKVCEDFHLTSPTAHFFKKKNATDNRKNICTISRTQPENNNNSGLASKKRREKILCYYCGKMMEMERQGKGANIVKLCKFCGRAIFSKCSVLKHRDKNAETKSMPLQNKDCNTADSAKSNPEEEAEYNGKKLSLASNGRQLKTDILDCAKNIKNVKLSKENSEVSGAQILMSTTEQLREKALMSEAPITAQGTADVDSSKERCNSDLKPKEMESVTFPTGKATQPREMGSVTFSTGIATQPREMESVTFSTGKATRPQEMDSVTFSTVKATQPREMDSVTCPMGKATQPREMESVTFSTGKATQPREMESVTFPTGKASQPREMESVTFSTGKATQPLRSSGEVTKGGMVTLYSSNNSKQQSNVKDRVLFGIKVPRKTALKITIPPYVWNLLKEFESSESLLSEHKADNVGNQTYHEKNVKIGKEICEDQNRKMVGNNTYNRSIAEDLMSRKPDKKQSSVFDGMEMERDINTDRQKKVGETDILNGQKREIQTEKILSKGQDTRTGKSVISDSKQNVSDNLQGCKSDHNITSLSSVKPPMSDWDMYGLLSSDETDTADENSNQFAELDYPKKITSQICVDKSYQNMDFDEGGGQERTQDSRITLPESRIHIGNNRSPLISSNKEPRHDGEKISASLLTKTSSQTPVSIRKPEALVIRKRKHAFPEESKNATCSKTLKSDIPQKSTKVNSSCEKLNLFSNMKKMYNTPVLDPCLNFFNHLILRDLQVLKPHLQKFGYFGCVSYLDDALLTLTRVMGDEEKYRCRGYSWQRKAVAINYIGLLILRPWNMIVQILKFKLKPALLQKLLDRKRRKRKSCRYQQKMTEINVPHKQKKKIERRNRYLKRGVITLMQPKRNFRICDIKKKNTEQKEQDRTALTTVDKVDTVGSTVDAFYDRPQILGNRFKALARADTIDMNEVDITVDDSRSANFLHDIERTNVDGGVDRIHTTVDAITDEMKVANVDDFRKDVHCTEFCVESGVDEVKAIMDSEVNSWLHGVDCYGDALSGISDFLKTQHNDTYSFTKPGNIEQSDLKHDTLQETLGDGSELSDLVNTFQLWVDKFCGSEHFDRSTVNSESDSHNTEDILESKAYNKREQSPKVSQNLPSEVRKILDNIFPFSSCGYSLCSIDNKELKQEQPGYSAEILSSNCSADSATPNYVWSNHNQRPTVDVIELDKDMDPHKMDMTDISMMDSSCLSGSGVVEGGSECTEILTTDVDGTGLLHCQDSDSSFELEDLEYNEYREYSGY